MILGIVRQELKRMNIKQSGAEIFTSRDKNSLSDERRSSDWMKVIGGLSKMRFHGSEHTQLAA